MQLVHHTPELRLLTTAAAQDGSIGFVPTMGALHAGHIALVQQALAENELVICSVFVNPTQFNDPKDLDKYPRTLERDAELLAEVGCQILFAPSVEEVYPDGTAASTEEIDLKGLDLGMEGAFRPGHFKGVVQVVKRLIEMTRPDRIYMGQKDYQQWRIVLEMVKQVGFDTEVVRCPIVREPSGLAMSSRNVRLSAAGRIQAAQLYATLQATAERYPELSPAQLSAWAKEQLTAHGFEYDYVEIVSGTDLQPLANWQTVAEIVLCATARLEGVRLLDNLILRPSK